MINLRQYQSDAKKAVYASWAAGSKVPFLILPTGTGKTVIFSNLLSEHTGACCAIAHRQELVGQISLALARDGVRHRIIGSKPTIKLCVALHMDELKTSYYDPGANCAVASVDTLIRQGAIGARWFNQISLWVMDEAHHILRSNKWGKAVAMFPNAKGLGVTATPGRTDGKGLGAQADGVATGLIVGFSGRAAIDQGYLTDYKIFCPPSNIDLSDVNITASGEYNRGKLSQAVKRSQIIGDIVQTYLRAAPGKLGVSFLPNVETATMVADDFNRWGVPAAVVTAKTPDRERIAILKRFKRRELLQLVNVDLFGEGFDLPAVEVVSFGRPTESFNLYVQQFGRVLRVLVDPYHMERWDSYAPARRRELIAASSKPVGIILDHVGNVVRHGLPDRPLEWSLESRERKDRGASELALKVCPKCTRVYERFYAACPYCGYKPEPIERSGPEFVDGDLLELDGATLAKMRGEIETIDRDPEEYRAELQAKGLPGIYAASNVKKLREKQAAQATLRDQIALWAGYQRAAGRPDSESYRRFYLRFGVDVLTAQALGVKEANALASRLLNIFKEGKAL